MYPPKLPKSPEQDFFACGKTAFHTIKNQLGLKAGCTEFEYNGFTFKLDKNFAHNQVAGIGPRCSVVAKEMQALANAGEI
ncbi:hypothetical protein VPHK449_0043 [Vibrio phage K449]